MILESFQVKSFHFFFKYPKHEWRKSSSVEIIADIWTSQIWNGTKYQNNRYKENHFKKLFHWNPSREQKVNWNAFPLNMSKTFHLS